MLTLVHVLVGSVVWVSLIVLGVLGIVAIVYAVSS